MNAKAIKYFFRRKLITVFMLLVCTLMFGQTKISHGPSLELQAAQIYFKDQNFSTLRFQGQSFALQVGYRYAKKKNYQWGFNINPEIGRLHYYKNLDGASTKKHFKSFLYKADFEINYLRQFNRIPYQLFIGVQLNTDLMLLDFNGFDNGSWLTSHNIGLTMLKEHKLNEKYYAQLQFSLPLISIAARPPYSEVDEFVVSNEDNIPKIIYSRNEGYLLPDVFRPSLDFYLYANRNKKRWYARASYEYAYLNSFRPYQHHKLALGFGIFFTKNKDDEK